MKLAIGAGLLALLAVPAFAQTQPQQQQRQLPPPVSGQALARADFVGTEGQRLGTASLVETPAGTLIQVRMENLPEGLHGFHIHETGQCEPPNFQSAGGHFNPTGASHGFLSENGPHGGDLPNVYVPPGGMLNVDILNPRVGLREGPNSLFREGGTALVVHAGPDDYATDPAGKSGDRIACGMIQRQTQPQ